MRILVHLFIKFLIIGSTSFGGYMALIAMIRQRFVMVEKQLDDDIITEGIAIASVLPGPVAVNVVAYVGYRLAGIRGAIVSVIAVLIPSFILVLVFSAMYFTYGEVLNAAAILKGIVPVVVALLLSVAANMGMKSVRKPIEVLLLTFSSVLFLVAPGYSVIVGVLVFSAMVGIFLSRKINKVVKRSATGRSGVGYLILAMGIFVIFYLMVRFFLADNISAQLFSEFASISLTLFGGGYVMVPILKSILVDQTNWFSLDEFMAGISIGQVTPGPILISAAFFGFKLNGIAGSVISTVAIFFPSSILMIMVSTFFNQYKTNHFVQAAISGIKPAIVGLLISAALSIFIDYLPGANLIFATGTLIITFLLFFRFTINPAIVVVISGLLGYLMYSV